jgi:hypothetical protein
MGAFFFAYSLKYYVATATMLLLAVLWSRPQRERIRAAEAERPPGCLAFTFWLIAYRWLVPDRELAGNTNRPIKT